MGPECVLTEFRVAIFVVHVPNVFLWMDDCHMISILGKKYTPNQTPVKTHQSDTVLTRNRNPVISTVIYEDLLGWEGLGFWEVG